MKPKIVLLNPPGSLRYQRDSYCSFVARGRAYFLPFDLLIQSGYLYGRAELLVIDAIVGGLNRETVISMMKNFKPDAVISITGIASLPEDMDFFRYLKQELPLTKLFLSGGCLLTNPSEYLDDYPFIDGILADFFNGEVLGVLENPEGSFCSIALPGRMSSGNPARVLSYPVPRHELFPLGKYHLPHSLHSPITRVNASFGCPYKCNFCIFTLTKFRLRDRDNFFEELDYIKSLNIRELFLGDQNFGIPAEHYRSICEGLLSRKYKFSWITALRADMVTPDFARLMKAAGCHTVQIGVESASDEILKLNNKNITVKTLKEGISTCKKAGLSVLVHIIFGLPGETDETARSTIKFLKEVKPDYAAINIAVPIRGTELERLSMEKGLIKEKVKQMDQSFSQPVISLSGLSPEKLREYVKTAFRQYYFSPSYLFGRILAIKTPYQLENMLYEGYSLFKNYMKRF